MVKIFISGTTGYIGGCVLDLLLQRKDQNYEITALARSAESAKQLIELGVNPIIGMADDHETIAHAASEADIVIEFADCDNLALASAIVDGLKRKLEITKEKGILIQTGGAGMLSNTRSGRPGELPMGSFSDVVYKDTETERLNSLPETQPHRHVDIFLIDNSDKYDLVIIAPCVVFGRAHGPFSHRQSISVPLVVQAALNNGVGKMIGKGTNRWSCCHVADLARVYIILLDRLLQGTLKTIGREGYYFAETGDISYGEISALVAETLYAKGEIPSAKVDVVDTLEGVKKAYGFTRALYYAGGNSRGLAVKARELGWKPKYGMKDFKASIDEVCDDLIEQKRANAAFVHQRWSLKQGGL